MPHCPVTVDIGRDGVYMQPLVPLVFHNLPSLYPLHLEEILVSPGVDMRTIQLLVLSLLLSLVEEVHCQQTYPYVSFMNQTLANHSYVNLSQVGSDFSYYYQEYPGPNVLCLTDLQSCCSRGQGPHRGDWYFPDGDRLPFTSPFVTIGEARGLWIVVIRRTTPTGPTGIYRCDIATVAVHNDTDRFTRETVYVGLYESDAGNCLFFSH